MTGLPDRIAPERTAAGDHVLYRFANGLEVRTEVFFRRDPRRILPLGSPQLAMMNRLAARPQAVAGRRVFEPFAGSGPLGLMALALGAARVDFLDLNPRACAFQRDNAARNGFDAARFACHEGDVVDFSLATPCDLLLANPPFVPTPDGLDGTLTSNGGADGNRLVGVLLDRLDAFLAPAGEAWVYVFQLVAGDRPLILDRLGPVAERRRVELVSSQANPIPFETYVEAYRKVFPGAGAAIEAWRRALLDDHGDDLTLRHYVVEIGPAGAGAGCAVRDDFAERYGAAFLVPSEKPEELAFGRVMENRIPGE